MARGRLERDFTRGYLKITCKVTKRKIRDITHSTGGRNTKKGGIERAKREYAGRG